MRQLRDDNEDEVNKIKANIDELRRTRTASNEQRLQVEPLHRRRAWRLCARCAFGLIGRSPPQVARGLEAAQASLVDALRSSNDMLAERDKVRAAAPGSCVLHASAT